MTWGRRAGTCARTSARGPAGALNVSRIAIACGDGSARLIEPVSWDDRQTFRAELGSLEVVTLSPNGRFLVGAEGDLVHVFDTENDDRVTLQPGPRPRHYERRFHLSAGGLLAMDRDGRIVVYRIEPRAD